MTEQVENKVADTTAITQEQPKEIKQDTTSVAPAQDTLKQQQQVEEDPNWRAFREGRKKDRLEREAAERKAAEKEAEVAALKAAMEAVFSKNSATPQAYQQHYGLAPEVYEESEDVKIEKKVSELLAKREAEYERQRQQREQQEYPQKLQRELPDFHNVISQENRDYLDYHFPEISRPLSRLPDGYDKWHDIYHAIKKLVPNTTSAKKDAAKADVNAMKPKSMSSPGLTQTQQQAAGILSEDKKAANWARMQKLLKGVG